MIALLQRVSEARVSVDEKPVAAIGPGVLALIAVQPRDDTTSASQLLDRVLGFRIFDDNHGKMALNLRQRGGELLLVPQFTLAVDTRHGRRPSFSTAAPREQAKHLFSVLTGLAVERHPTVACGVFGAHMQVSLTNDGPVTFWVED